MFVRRIGQTWKSIVGACRFPQCLMFHSVGESGELAPVRPQDAVSESAFRTIIGEIATLCRPTSVPELVERLQRGSVPERTVTVTFDDGFADNLTTVLPILEEFNVPATVYVATGFVDRTVRPFQYDLASLICQCATVRFQRNGVEQIWHLDDASGRVDCYSSIYRELKPESAERRSAAMLELNSQCKRLPNHAERYLCWERLRELAASPLITIGGHTHHHLVLDAVDRKEMRADIAKGKQLLEEHLGEPITHFSFPYGHHDRFVRNTVRELGFNSAMSIGTQYPWQRWDPFNIKRMPVSDASFSTIFNAA